MVKDRVVVPFRGMLAAPKDLAICGEPMAATVTEALAVLPVPPLAEVTALVVLFCTPEAAPVTVHAPPGEGAAIAWLYRHGRVMQR